MNKLPNEVLNGIFLLLHQHDKVECMLVCHRWSVLIKSTCLFHTVQLNNETGLKGLVLQSTSSKLTQTERLIVYIPTKENVDFTRLFPNLQVIVLRTAWPRSSEIVPLQREIRLKHIVEDMSYSFTYHLLSRNNCPNLTTIMVSSISRSTAAIRLIRLLNNAPNLTYLSMRSFVLSMFSDLEVLHKSAPFLKSVNFQCTYLKLEKPCSFDIIPVKSVTSFTLENLNRRTTLFSYILKKYPNLDELALIALLPPFAITTMDAHFTRLMEGLNLQTLSIVVNQDSIDIFNILDATQHCIKKLSLYTDDASSIILDKLAYSDQAKSLEILRLINISISGDSYCVLLEKLAALKSLFLEPRKTDRVKETMDGPIVEKAFPVISLDKLLNSCSSKELESITISHSTLILNTTFITTRSTITYFELFNIILPEKLDTYISTCMPQLKRLVLAHCALFGKRFSLPHHRLSLLEIIEGVDFRNSHLLLITKNKEERRWFISKKRYYDYKFIKKYIDIDSATSPCAPTSSCNPTKTIPDIVFICDYVENLVFLNY